MKNAFYCFVAMLIFVPSTHASTYNVLWDMSHGVHDDYRPSGNFSPVVQILLSNSIGVDSTSRGFLQEDLSGYQALVVCVSDSWDTAYSTDEVQKIADYVWNGGGLLILGENTWCPNNNIAPVANKFGVTLGVSDLISRDISAYYPVYTNSFASHPIFNGIDEIGMMAPGEIIATSPSTALAWHTSSGKELVAVAEYGTGRVITIGDQNLFSCGDANTKRPDFTTLADNAPFAVNVFNYLLVPEPSTIALLLTACVGGLLWWRRRR